MSSAKHIAVFVFASSVASVAVAQADPASLSLVVNREKQLVQTPTLPGTAGISYAGGSPSPLKVYTDGFLFCANVSNDQIISSPTYFVAAHEDQSFLPSAAAHSWLFNAVTDVASVNYDGSQIVVNNNPQTTLTCHGARADGAVATAVSEGIFDNGLESSTDINFNHLINWIPTTGFSWATPDWSTVPTDPCSPTVNAPAKVVEDVACAAVTGVRPGNTGPAVRAGSIWTATDGSTFTYLFRFDARFGAQAPGPAPAMQLPQTNGTAVVDSSTAAKISVRDAFDQTFLKAAAGSYCLLTEVQLPTILNSNVCTGASPQTLNGPLDVQYEVGVPPGGTATRSFYIAVNRPVIGGHSTLTTPVVGVSALTDPAVVSEGGDKFSGDNIIFGFMPASSGFPWMYGQ